MTITPAELEAFAAQVGEQPVNEGHGFLALHLPGMDVYAAVGAL
jgi:hypothetical protein